MTHSKNISATEAASEGSFVVGFDPALYERWHPKASRVGNEQPTIPLFVRRVPDTPTKEEASLFLDRLTLAHIELARILAEQEAEHHPTNSDAKQF